MLSCDDLFQSVGNNTDINYARDFDEYLSFLLSGLRRKKKSVLNLFREWDHVVFPNSESSLIGQNTVNSSGFKTAMQMLDDDEVEVDGKGEGEGEDEINNDDGENSF